MHEPACPLCESAGGVLLVSHHHWRVIDASDPWFTGVTRVIWNNHVREMSDLSRVDQHELLAVMMTVELIMRQTLKPDKINLASLGNQVPHLHWHVIPRWQDDPTFPGSVWSPMSTEAARAERSSESRLSILACLSDYHAALREQLRKDFP